MDRAKTQIQLNRNGALRKAVDVLKKEVGGDTKVEIVWRKIGSRDREVTVNGDQAFRQTIDDSQGVFLAGFAACRI